MDLKQVNAAEDTATVIEGITGIFQTLNMQRLANTSLYLGTPQSVLVNFYQQLCEQRFEDEKKKFLSRMKYAGIFKERTEETFKWDKDTYPLAEPGIIEAALSIDFVKHCQSLIVAGPPGAGKSLLVTIIACKALRAGFSVMYKTAHDIATKLRESRAGNSLSGYIKKLQARDVLIIEDVTFATFDKSTAQAFFSFMDKRYGRKTTIVTANDSISEWAAKFPNQSMSSAILGRFYENALLINMNGAEDKRLSKAKAFLDKNINTSTDRGM
jgi:DNA replication protein DnaC